MRKNIVKSAELESYKLPKPIMAVLDRVQKMDQYMLTAGVKKPPFIRLFRHDVLAIDNAIRSRSEKTFDITKVTYLGRKIITSDAPEPSSTLDALP